MPHKIAPDPEHVPWCRAELETWQSFQQTLQLPRASAYRPWKSWKLLDKHDDKTLLVTAAPVPTGPHWWHVAARNCQGSKLLPRIQTLIFYWRRQYTYTKVWLSTEVKIHTVVFRIMTICILVCEHQIFWKISVPFYTEHGIRIFLRNAVTHFPFYNVSHRRDGHNKNFNIFRAQSFYQNFRSD